MENHKRMKYAVEQRLRLIDFLLDHYGFINREMVEDYFGISTPQASKDMKEYVKLAPDNTFYSTNKKCYLKHPEFKRLF